MKKLIIPILLSITAVLTMGATKCDPNNGPADPTKVSYTWEVYAADSKCTCKDNDPAQWQFATHLVEVEYGFLLGSGTTATSHEYGESTPFSRSGKGIDRAVHVVLSAHAIDSSVKLLCIIKENGLALTPVAGQGLCSVAYKCTEEASVTETKSP